MDLCVSKRGNCDELQKAANRGDLRCTSNSVSGAQFALWTKFVLKYYFNWIITLLDPLTIMNYEIEEMSKWSNLLHLWMQVTDYPSLNPIWILNDIFFCPQTWGKQTLIEKLQFISTSINTYIFKFSTREKFYHFFDKTFYKLAKCTIAIFCRLSKHKSQSRCLRTNY